MAIEYNFKYMPLVGKLSGKSMAEQTETAINEIAKIVNDNTAQAEIINILAEEANANSVEALKKANEALETSGRVYIKETGAVDLDSYCESQLIYINNVFSQNLPVASKGFLEVKTNDDKTEATQVFIDDTNKEVYTRSGAITETTVGDVITYTASYSAWNKAASTNYVENMVLIRQNSTAYALGDIARSTSLASYMLLVCTTAGTTGATDPNFAGVGVGGTVTDGTAVWTLREFATLDSETVGGTDTPVYVSGGTITAGGKIVPIQNNAGFHNSIFRGKYLGTSLTAAQSAAIQAGTFDDMFIGDYWVIGGYNWRIGMFDPWYNVGDTNFATHHLGIIPDTVLYNAQYNTSNTTEGGYVGSALYSGIGTARTTVKNAFGAAHVPTHRILLPTTCTGGKYTSWALRDEDIMLPTEVMVYGTRAWGDSGNNGYSVASQDCQWPLFALSPQHRHTRQNYWLQDVSSASGFAYVTGNGYASGNAASVSCGVRPAFALI